MPGAVTDAVVRQHRAAVYSLAVEPEHRPEEQTHPRRLQLIRQELDVGQPHNVIYVHVPLCQES